MTVEQRYQAAIREIGGGGRGASQSPRGCEEYSEKDYGSGNKNSAVGSNRREEREVRA